VREVARHQGRRNSAQGLDLIASRVVV
jgi:hypothetical protein